MGINISFIIPTYNPSEDKDFFYECLKSIELIFHEGDEVLVIDDGSNNTKYITNTCNKYDNITILRLEENKGISYARNIGIRTCKNDYYAIVDSDDYIFDAEAFERVRNQIKPSNNADMYIFGTASSIKGELVQNMGIMDPDDTEDLRINILFTPLANYHPRLYSAGNAWAKIYRKKFTIDNNLMYEEIPHRAEDCVFFMDYLAANPRIKVIEEYAYFYRINEESVTHRYNPDMYKLISITVKSFGKRIDLNNPKEYEAVLYRKVSYIATAMNNIFHINNKSSLYNKYKASQAILWSDDNLDALQSVNFSRYSFGKCNLLLRMLRYNMILVPVILLEIRRRGIIAKRVTITYLHNIKSAVDIIKTNHNSARRAKEQTPSFNRIKSADI